MNQIPKMRAWWDDKMWEVISYRSEKFLNIYSDGANNDNVPPILPLKIPFPVMPNVCVPALAPFTVDVNVTSLARILRLPPKVAAP